MKNILVTDENITFEITEKGTATAEVLHPTSQEKIVFYLQNVPFGIQKMSGTIKGLVETSSNIGILRLDRDELFASSSVRSSVDAACSALSDKIEYLTEFLGGDYEVQGAYRHGSTERNLHYEIKWLQFLRKCMAIS